MPLLKKTIMWVFFAAAMYFGGSMTQSGNNLLQGMGFMSILASLICLYLVLKLVWGPLSHYAKLALFIGVIWFGAYSIGLFDGKTLQSFLSGSPVTPEVKAGNQENIADLDSLNKEMFGNSDSDKSDAAAEQTGQTEQAANEENTWDDGGIVGKLKTFLFGKQKTQAAPVKRAFNPLDYPEIRGYPSVISGSILVLEGIKIKLFGIDAPDPDQTCLNRLESSYECGMNSLTWLQEWLNGKEVSCHILNKIENGWTTGSCFTDDNKYDVAAVVVNAGWAVAYTDVTDIYLPYEQQAEAERRGLWCGTFYKPWDWRSLQNRRFKVKIHKPKPSSANSGSGGGFNFWGLF